MRWNAECIILKSLNSKCQLLALLLSSWSDPAHCLRWDNKGLDIVTLPAPHPSLDDTHPEYFLGKGSDQPRAFSKWGSSLQALTYTFKSSSSRSAPNTVHPQLEPQIPQEGLCSDKYLLWNVYRTEAMEAIQRPQIFESCPRGESQGEVFWGQMRRSWMLQDPNRRRQVASVAHFPGPRLHLREAKGHFTPELR